MRVGSLYRLPTYGWIGVFAGHRETPNIKSKMIWVKGGSSKGMNVPSSYGTCRTTYIKEFLLPFEFLSGGK